MASPYKLISVDLWDTILRRRCAPDEIKLIVAKHIYLNFHHLLRLAYSDIDLILHERRTAEHDIGQATLSTGFDDEYSLLEVNSLLIPRVFQPLTKRVRQELIQEITQFEIQAEIESTYLDPQIVETLRSYPRIPKVILSDFYMSKEQITQILATKPLPVKFAGIFSSSDIRVNKRSGQAFKFLHSEFQVQPQEHLHIGDNLRSDVEVPSSLGISTLHHWVAGEEEYRKVYSQALSKRLDMTDSSTYWARLQDRLRLVQPKAGLAEYQQQLFSLGVKHAPFLVMFVQNILEESSKNQLKQVHYLTREGEFFAQIHRQIATTGSFNQLSPNILEVSRLATFVGSLESAEPQELMRLWNLYSTQSLNAMCQSLRLDASKVYALAAKYELDMFQPIQYPWEDSRVQALFRHKGFQKLLQRHILKERRLLLQYLESRGLTSQVPSVALCDIGWRGTIQDNLAYLLPKTKLVGHYLALNKFLNPQPANVYKQSFGPDLNTNRLEELHPHILQNVSVIEMLCNSGRGSVQEYRQASGKMVAKRLSNSGENQVHQKYVKYFQQGVLAAAPEIALFLEQHGLLAEHFAADAVQNFSQLVLRPPRVLIQAYRELHHNEIFGAGSFSRRNYHPPLHHLILAPLMGRYQSKLEKYLQETGWSNWRPGFEKYYHLDKLQILSTPPRKFYVTLRDRFSQYGHK